MIESSADSQSVEAQLQDIKQALQDQLFLLVKMNEKLNEVFDDQVKSYGGTA